MHLCVYTYWLEDTFLPYLEDWKKSVASREGFERPEKKRMLLSDETLLGFQMTGMIVSSYLTYLHVLYIVVVLLQQTPLLVWYATRSLYPK